MLKIFLILVINKKILNIIIFIEKIKINTVLPDLPNR